MMDRSLVGLTIEWPLVVENPTRSSLGSRSRKRLAAASTLFPRLNDIDRSSSRITNVLGAITVRASPALGDVSVDWDSTKLSTFTGAGCPSSVTVKFSGTNPRAGRPSLSKATTSTDTMLTVLLNVGVCFASTDVARTTAKTTGQSRRPSLIVRMCRTNSA